MAIYSINQVAAITGVSSHMLNYLCCQEIILAGYENDQPGRGRRRLFNQADIVTVLVVDLVRKRGIDANSLRKSIGAIKALLEANGRPDVYLISNGSDVLIHRDKEGSLQHAFAAPFHVSVCINLRVIADDAKEKITAYKMKNADLAVKKPSRGPKKPRTAEKHPD